MNAQGCCHATRGREQSSRPASRGRRGMETAGWLFSSGLLVLMPKCPLCVAAYVAMFSGIGISVAGATMLRTSLLVLCVSALAFLAGKRLINLAHGKRRHQ